MQTKGSSCVALRLLGETLSYNDHRELALQIFKEAAQLSDRRAQFRLYEVDRSMYECKLPSQLLTQSLGPKVSHNMDIVSFFTAWVQVLYDVSEKKQSDEMLVYFGTLLKDHRQMLMGRSIFKRAMAFGHRALRVYDACSERARQAVTMVKKNKFIIRDVALIIARRLMADRDAWTECVRRDTARLKRKEKKMKKQDF